MDAAPLSFPLSPSFYLPALALFALVMVFIVVRRVRRGQGRELDPLTRWAVQTLMPDDTQVPASAMAGPRYATQTELDRIDKRADKVLMGMQKKMPGFHFDEKSVRFLSRLLNAQRTRVLPAEWGKLAPYYGAYLGKAILYCHRQLQGRWARENDDWVLVFPVADGTRTLDPMQRVRQQLQYGEEFAMYRFFATVPELLRQQG